MLFAAGRILFALLFIFSGISKFFDIGVTAQIIEAKLGTPAFAAPYVAQVETAVGMTAFRLLALVAAGVEVFCGLMIAFNLAARFFAFLLLVFVVIVTLGVHDFWNQDGGSARLENIVHFMKNISIAGALLMIMGQRHDPTPGPELAYRNRVDL
jgi:putative oxidoreductase